jgi:hypothetical protein
MNMLVTFMRRLAGAAMLDAGTYEEIEADRGATTHAFLVVVLSSLAAGIGLNGARGTEATLSFFLVASVLALASWATFALITFHVGTRLLPHADTRANT